MVVQWEGSRKNNIKRTQLGARMTSIEYSSIKALILAVNLYEI